MATEVIETKKLELVINKMSRTAFDTLSAQEGGLNDNELYFVLDDDLNAENKKLVNLKSPDVSSDAATKGYVDDTLDSQLQRSLSAKSDLELMAPAFSPLSAYASSSWVIYNQKLYQCSADVEAGAWNPAKWVQKAAMTTPDYQFQALDDTNIFKIVQKEGDQVVTKWSIEYREAKVSALTSSVVLKSGDSTSLTLGLSSDPALTLQFLAKDQGYIRDTMLFVTLPSAGEGIQTLTLSSDVVPIWIGDNPMTSFDPVKDRGKQFVYGFCDTPTGKMLVSRQELTGYPALFSATGSAAGTISQAAAATLSGEFVIKASKVEWCADTTTPTWNTISAANYTIISDREITLSQTATSSMTLASGTAGIRVTTANGTALLSGLTITA